MGQRPGGAGEAGREATWWMLLAIALCAAAVFAVPYDYISDETVYLDQAVSLYLEEPRGWSIRSFVYPALLAGVSRVVGKLVPLGPEDVVVIVRVANLALGLGSLAALGALARRLFDPLVATLAVALTGLSWWWLFAMRRLMMDVPAGAFLVLAACVISGGLARRRDVVLATVCCALAVMVKFQAAPAAVALAVLGPMVVDRPAGSRREALGWVLGTGILMAAVQGLVDLVTLGAPFRSAIDFYEYNLTGGEHIARLYGCLGPGRHVQLFASAFSVPLPWLALGGAALALRGRQRLCWLLAGAVGFYLAALWPVCQKWERFLYVVAPFLSLFAAVAIARLAGFAATRWSARRLVDPARVGIAALLAAVTLVAMVPFNRARAIVSQTESCGDFALALRPALRVRSDLEAVGMAPPCEVPTIFFPFLQPKDVYTAADADAFSHRAGVLFVATATDLGRHVAGSGDGVYVLLGRSRGGHYAAYRAAGPRAAGSRQSSTSSRPRGSPEVSP